MPETMLAHTVLFTLADRSDEARQQLVADCRKYLSGHPGTVFFAVGTLAADIEWSVSDRSFDVALYLVFESRAAHDRYQESDEHGRFLDEHESTWASLRVLDVDLSGAIAAGSPRG